MKETRVFAWCDMHQPEKVEATETRSLSMDGKPRRTLDLCEQHDKELDELAELLDRFGELSVTASTPLTTPMGQRGPKGSKLADGTQFRNREVDCEICGMGVIRSSLVGHIWSHYALPRPPAPTKCPDCGVEFKANSISMHRRSQHNYDAVAEAYVAVRRHPK